MNRVKELLVVHHSHTDWGYTTHQSVIQEIHFRFLDEAVRLCDGNDQRPDSLRYRWTCESAWVVREYLRARSPKQRQSFLNCVFAGDIEVAALPLHPTPLADEKTIRAALTVLGDLRQEGVPVSVALACDINGLNWPWADALLDSGISALCMAMNFVCGGGMPRWTYFQWKAPSGRLLPCWQGTHYNQGAYWGLNHNAYGIAEVAGQRVKELERVPFEKLLLQVTNIPPDNMGPHPDYLNGLEEYNRLAVENDWPRMRTSTLTEWTAWLAAQTENSPEYEGDWTDWWAAGIASTPRETAALLDSQRRISIAEAKGVSPDIAIEVRKKIFLAAEHTWGASTSIKAPYLLSTQAGISAKQNLIYEAAYAANEALRGSLGADTVMHDPAFESFDPAWSALAERASTNGEHASSSSPPENGATPDWSQLLGADFGRVLIEEPENGDRAAWYEKGSFREPDGAGKWADGSQLSRERLVEANVTTRQEGTELHVEVAFSLDYTTAPRAAYIIFPFSQKADIVSAEVGGAWTDPRLPQVPGSCVNWWTLHHGVFISGEDRALLWTSWDAPLTMFDAPCSTPPKEANDLSRPTIISWALNTYWFTNFHALSGGEYRFRYRIKYWPSVIGLEEIENYVRDNPLPQYPYFAHRQPLTQSQQQAL